MSERYRLVFRGEVLDGQHKAVVKQRLGAALKVEGERLDAMFTGKATTIRREADTDTAARFQIVFKRAGARLRVLPVAAGAEAEPAGEPPATTDDGGFRLAPPGARMAASTPAVAQPALDLTHLTLAAAGVVLGVPRPVDAVAPDVSHLTVAAAGTDLGVARPAPPVRMKSPTWDVAEVGADLGPHAPLIEPPFELDAIEFDLAPVGTLLVDAGEEPAPPPPDTSHLRLQ